MKFIIGFFYLVFTLIFAKADLNSCFQCDSADDPECAKFPENLLPKPCQNTTSACYTRIQNGDTIRGCASDLEDATKSKCNNDRECEMCSQFDGCNCHIFPQGRVQCLQCSGNSTGDCALDVRAKPLVCHIYTDSDSCYIRRTNKNDTDSFQRGCLSTAQRNKRCIDVNNCFTCEGVGCNYLMADSDRIPRDGATFIGSSMMLLYICSAFPAIFSLYWVHWGIDK